jgi:hypothetical protein
MLSTSAAAISALRTVTCFRGSAGAADLSSGTDPASGLAVGFRLGMTPLPVLQLVSADRR